MVKKTWLPGKTLARFITANFGIPEKERKEIVARISDALADASVAQGKSVEPRNDLGELERCALPYVSGRATLSGCLCCCAGYSCFSAQRF
jgi:hypothetical protein